jgi:hypothetical protein
MRKNTFSFKVLLGIIFNSGLFILQYSFVYTIIEITKLTPKVFCQLSQQSFVQWNQSNITVFTEHHPHPLSQQRDIAPPPTLSLAGRESPHSHNFVIIAEPIIKMQEDNAP